MRARFGKWVFDCLVIWILLIRKRGLWEEHTSETPTDLPLSSQQKEITTCPSPLSYSPFSLWSNIWDTFAQLYPMFFLFLLNRCSKCCPRSSSSLWSPSSLSSLQSASLQVKLFFIVTIEPKLVLQKKMNYTVKKGYRFSRPHTSRDVTNQTLPGGEQFNYCIPCQEKFGQ